MTQDRQPFPPIGAILAGPRWPDRVRVVRVEPQGTRRVLIEAVTLNEHARLISRMVRVSDLAEMAIETEAEQAPLDGDPIGFRLAAEATRI